MRLKFVVRDIDYMRAISDAIGRADQKVYMEVGRDLSTDDMTLLVTDFTPDEIENDFHVDDGEIIYITEDKNFCDIDAKRDRKFIYKYNRVSTTLAELKMYYFIKTGEKSEFKGDAMLLSVATSLDGSMTAAFSSMLARQFAYRTGGNPLILPMSYSDHSGSIHDDSDNAFIKMMYFIQGKADFPIETFIYRDKFGISYPRTGCGINPIARLDRSEKESLIEYVSSHGFDIVIMDIGPELSEDNADLARRSAEKFWIHRASSYESRADSMIRDFYNDAECHTVDMDIGLDHLPITADEYIRKIFELEGEYERHSDALRV